MRVSPFVVVWLAVIVGTAVRAEADGFHLGNGQDGAVSITGANTVINSYAQVAAPISPGDTVVSATAFMPSG